MSHTGILIAVVILPSSNFFQFCYDCGCYSYHFSLTLQIFTPRQNKGYCNHNVCRRLSVAVVCGHSCEHNNLTNSYPIFTGLILYRKWRTLLNFVMMTSSVTSQWRHFRYFAPWAYEHDNLTIFHPISTKLGMIDVMWVLTNPIEWRHDDVISDVIADRFRLE